MSAIGVAAAARNNAAWNLVSLGPEPAPAVAGVRELERVRAAASWSIKDSFATLALEREGFRILFEAEWIVRAAIARRSAVGTRFRKVESEAELAAWERAWGQSAGQSRIFLPSPLERSEIAILAARDRDGGIVAGVVANRAADAVGITNLFVCEREGESTRAECIEAAAEAFPRRAARPSRASLSARRAGAVVWSEQVH